MTGQVPSPVNAPVGVPAGHLLATGSNPQQLVDGGAAGGAASKGLGTSVVDPGTGNLESVLPVQTVTGAAKSFLAADLFKETRRSNGGAAMADTFPPASTVGLVNGTRIVTNNVDTSSVTITAGSGTTINSGPTAAVGPMRSVTWVYDAPNTMWRSTNNGLNSLLANNNLGDLSSIPSARSSLQLRLLADQLPGVERRLPELTDDSSHGHLNPFSFWSFWETEGSARVYQQMLNNAGYPGWLDLTATGVALPGDAASVAPAAIFALRQVVSAYSSSIIQARFSDGTTYAVPQLPNGQPDQRTLWKMGVAHGMPARVDVWYDESGNGYNATGSADAVITGSTIVGTALTVGAVASGTVAIGQTVTGLGVLPGTTISSGSGTAWVVNNSQNIPSTTLTLNDHRPLLTIDRDGDLAIDWDQWNGTVQQNRFLTLPNGLTITQNSFTVFGVSSLRDAGGDLNGTNLIQLGNTGGSSAAQLISYWSGGLTFTFSGLAGPWLPAVPTMFYAISAPSLLTVFADGNAAATKSASLGSNSLTGGVFGMTPGTPSGGSIGTSTGSRDYLKIIYASPLSAADVLAVQTSIYAMRKVVPQARFNIMCVGESVMEGFHTPFEQSGMQQLQEQLPRSAKIFNFGVAGQGIGTGSNNSINNYSQNAAKIFNAAALGNVLIFNAGNTNDYWVSSGSPLISATQELSYITTFIQNAWLTGQWAAILVLMPIDRVGGSAGCYTQLSTIAAGILTLSSAAQAAGGGFVPVRLDLNPAFGNYNSSASNGAIYIDGAHLTPLGGALWSATIRAALAPFVIP